MWPVFLLLLWLGPVVPKQKTGTCSQPQPLCCPGADYHCKSGNCYCDEYCHVLSDCCPDHKALCNPAAHTPKIVLQMVLRMRSPLGSANSNQDWVQSMVLQLLHNNLTRRPLSVTVKGIRKEA